MQSAVTLGAGSQNIPRCPFSLTVAITSPYWKHEPWAENEHCYFTFIWSDHLEGNRKKWTVTPSKKWITWYPEKALGSAVDTWSLLSSEPKTKLLNCLKSESKLLSVGRAGGGWENTSTPRENTYCSQQGRNVERGKKKIVLCDMAAFWLYTQQTTTRAKILCILSFLAI